MSTLSPQPPRDAAEALQILAQEHPIPEEVSLALNLLVTEFLAAMILEARRQGCTYDEARDIAQEMLIKLPQIAPTFTPGNPVAPWLLACTRHHAISFLRKRKPTSFPDGLSEVLPQEGPGPAELAEVEAEDALFARALAVLPPRHVAVCRACWLEGRTVAEVAAEQHISVGRIYRLLREAEEKLDEAGLIDIRAKVWPKVRDLFRLLDELWPRREWEPWLFELKSHLRRDSAAAYEAWHGLNRIGKAVRARTYRSPARVAAALQKLVQSVCERGP
jgi:RNA polymerase sigma factor (sigma-70 family)